MMNYKKTNKSKPRGRPQVSTLKRLTKIGNSEVLKARL